MKIRIINDAFHMDGEEVEVANDGLGYWFEDDTGMMQFVYKSEEGELFERVMDENTGKTG